MSSSGLTSGAQLRYILEWFGEFSELQREDFLPILAAASQGKPDQLANILASLSCQDKPLSLFQCRIKLFNEWFPTWTEEDQNKLVKGVSEIDAEFGKKLQDIVENGFTVNGDSNGFNGTCSPDIPEAEEPVKEPEELAPTPEDKPEESINDAIVENNIPVEIAAAS